MLYARKKRTENIGDYLIYLFQVEDIIRACGFDQSRIEEMVKNRFDVPEKLKMEIIAWYCNIMLIMEKENIRDRGHLQIVSNLVNDLNEFHLKLIETGSDLQYSHDFRTTAGLINEFRQKSNPEANDVETCLNAVYGFHLLQMQNTAVSPETMRSIGKIYLLINSLSALYKQFESGDFEF